MISILPYGDEAVLVNFEQKIDFTIHHEVFQLLKFLSEENFEGVKTFIPAYASLTIKYDSNITSFQSISEKIEHFISNDNMTAFDFSKKRKVVVPVCYDLTYALDSKEICQQTGISFEEIIAKHTSQIYQVFMMGFLPGFAYLGKLPNELQCSRKSNPRKKVEKGSVAIAGVQTGIYPSDAPGGWQIIGKTPIPVFDAEQDDPFFFQTGDQVQFQSISKKTFQQIEMDIANDKFERQFFYE